MPPEHQRFTTIASLACLVAGGALLAYGQGHFPFGVAAVAGAVLVIRFFRTTRAWLALPLFVLVHALVWEWAYRGMVPLPTPARLGMEAGVSLLLGLVFVVEAWTSRRSPAFVTTLVFPAGWVAFDFLSARLSPGATWGSIAYTFAESPLGQMAAWTGWTGITFLVGWAASTTNWCWERRCRMAVMLRGAAITLAVLLFAMIGGSLRLATSETPRALVHTACIVAPSTFDDEHIEDVWAYTRGVEQTDEGIARARSRIRASMDQHFARVEDALRAGVDLAVWAEANATLTSREESEWIERGTDLAQAYEAYIGMGLFVFRPETGEPSINKLVLLDPRGDVVIDFIKATRPPGVGHIVGDGVLPVVDTSIGAVSSAICYDLDFPHVVGRIGRADVDLLLAPSNDWQEAAATHARMAVMRSIEQGVSLVRPTKDGVSLTTDAIGRVIGRRDDFTSVDPMLITAVPIGGRRTLYGATGDALPWLCVVVFAAIPIGLRVRRRVVPLPG